MGKCYTCWPVVTEVAYMLRKQPAQRDDFLQAVIDEDFVLLPLSPRDLEPVRVIFSRYNDQNLDLADACLLHLADAKRLTRSLRVDRRHFEMLRKADGTALRLLPDID